MPEPIGLSRTLQSRHVAMISIGGIIGAGLFVGSSAAIASIGPAVIFSYIIAGLLILFSMRMLGELALANPEIGFFTITPARCWAMAGALSADGCIGISG
jgi:L-asparagine transporter-like permease